MINAVSLDETATKYNESEVKMITDKQQQVIDFITSYKSIHGYPPTQSEIATAIGVKSSNAARQHLLALERKGLIEFKPYISRGIRVL